MRHAPAAMNVGEGVLEFVLGEGSPSYPITPVLSGRESGTRADTSAFQRRCRRLGGPPPSPLGTKNGLIVHGLYTHHR